MSDANPTLRSRQRFTNSRNPSMTALYLERFELRLTRAELQSGKPIIGIAQTGSDLVPCNRHHLQFAERVRDGIRDAGGSHPDGVSGSPARRRRRENGRPRRSTGNSRISVLSAVTKRRHRH
jgi:dihydroxyacid dehydratase/phosphogluconate dehydratase